MHRDMSKKRTNLRTRILHEAKFELMLNWHYEDSDKASMLKEVVDRLTLKKDSPNI